MANTFRKIQTVTVGSGGASSIDFTSIPQTYTDLKIVMSLRSTGTGVSTRYAAVSFNSNTSNYTYRRLYGNGSSTGSDNGSLRIIGTIPGSTVTASVFGSIELYVPNYTSANNKSYSCDSVEENNATGAEQDMIAGLWSNTAAITSVTLTSDVGNFAEYSTATLYGISNVPVAEGAKATGGIITADNNYIYHTFLSSGTFTPTQSITCDYLVVAGGGSGAKLRGAGGGAGGVRCTVGATGGGGTLETPLSLTATAYTVTVGAGGAEKTSEVTNGNNGSNSVFGSITSTGGGGGGTYNTGTGNNGGSGGGCTVDSPATKGTGTANQGYDGGVGAGAPNYGTGGGGGANAVGGNGTTTVGGAGGAGVATSISGSSVTYAGGGGGSTYSGGTPGAGGAGGGGAGTANNNTGVAGTVNTGGGGGGGGYTSGAGGNGGAGGSGIVIVRYAR